MSALRTLAAVLAAGALLAFPAHAKEGVRAYLDAPVNMESAAGERLHVKWHLRDAKGNGFGGGGIYLRVSRCGRAPLRIRAIDRGRSAYSARVRVPAGGMRKLAVGLPGWRTYRGETERADAIFQFNPPLRSRRACPQR